jgi:hypothetical protein
MSKEPQAPVGSEVEYHCSTLWHYATIDGIHFKVCVDEDGDTQIREFDGGKWVYRGMDYSEIADMIFAAVDCNNGGE